MNDPFCVLGHSSAIRDFYIPDNEHYFLSASRDKTVKLWLLKNHGNGTAHLGCSKTYDAHARAVFTVQGIESKRLVASCDGVVHVSGNLISCLKNVPIFISRRNQRIWTHLLKKSLMENFIFCAVSDSKNSWRKMGSKFFLFHFPMFKKKLRRFLEGIDLTNICLSKFSNRNTRKRFEN